MSFFIRYCLLFIATVASVHAFQADTTIAAGEFDSESHLGIQHTIRSEDGQITYIRNNSWVVYQNFNFESGVNHFWIEGASPNAGGSVELRTGSEDGPIIGFVNISNTGEWDEYKKFSTGVLPAISGIHDLYFKFTGEGGYLFNLQNFCFLTIAPGQKIPASAFASGNFDLESAPGGEPVIADSSVITSITGNSWAAYTGFDFGAETNRFTIEGASPGKGGMIELRTGSEFGPAIGRIDIPHTGSWSHFRSFSCVLAQTTSGVHDLYLCFVNSHLTVGSLFHTREFFFEREIPQSMFPSSADEDNDQTPPLIEHATGMHQQSKDQLPLRMAVKAATANGVHHDIEVRLRSDKALVTKLLVSLDLTQWDEVTVFHQNGAWQTDDVNVTISEVTAQSDGLYLIRLNDSRTQTRLFTRLSVATAEGNVHVYPPVNGLDPSPYYSFSVQKVSALNASAKEDASNWLQPFAWFTKCVDQNDHVPHTAYYSDFIGGWSHTYCNFEVDPHTPIVVKITRLDKVGAPSGPIISASARPEHKVISCEVIGGDVYVTMTQPGLVAIDIDGQMDSRDAPRAKPDTWDSKSFPYKNELDGAHGVTVFANPFIEGKPQIDDPSVYAVSPGTLPPTNGPWTTLYFLPGIHKFSVDVNGNEREWLPSDVYVPRSNKNYYIPGDAIVYGNFNDLSDSEDSIKVRIFGHGTVSGSKIPHFQDFAAGTMPGGDNSKLRIMHLTRARGCAYEGITVADPPEHGIYIEGYAGNLAPNIIKWVKSITWRVNNDGGGVQGNSTIEDCFFRHQDDAIYVRGLAIRRCVLWSDVNGIPFRTSFISGDFPNTSQQDTTVEDCDVIYARGVFAFSNATDFGVIGSPDTTSIKPYADGTINTGQHIVFRNIRISDPKPVRYLFGFDARNPGAPLAGLRFENVDYQHSHTWGWRNRVLGNGTTEIHHWTFDRVFINGEHLDAELFNDPVKFETNSVSEMIFK